MIRISRVYNNTDPSEIRFDNYSIAVQTFLRRNTRGYWVWKNEYKYLKDFLRDICNNNDTLYVILNNQNEVIDMIPVNLPNYLIPFHKKHRNNYSNYALTVEKFGRFSKNKLEYMHPNGRGLFYKYSPNLDLLKSIDEKSGAQLATLAEQKNSIETKTLTQNWRMSMGLGNASAYNNGFTFHPIYGIPYIPGQAVKGIVRSFIISSCFNKEETEAEKDPVFCYLFGCSKNSYDSTARSGKVIFLDAFPIDSFSMEPDIMNSHFSSYYGGNEHPTDRIKPQPIFFLSVKEATYKFSLYIKEKFNIPLKEYQYCNKEKELVSYENLDTKKDIFSIENKKAVELVGEVLIQALKYHGVGAKTAVGYGRFVEKRY